MIAPLALREKSKNLLGSLIREVSKDAMEKPGLIPLWFGEGSRTAPAAVVAEAHKAIDDGYQFYASSLGRPELRTAIADYVRRLRGVDVDADRICVTASGNSAIQMAMQLIVDPGDNVVFAVPLWPNAADMVQHLNGEVRRVPLALGPRGWSLDLERLFAACDARTKAIFLNSPGNPTGWLATPEELKAVVEFCRKRGIWAIGDDVYERIVYDAEKSPSLLDFAGPDDPVMIVNSFSKGWCMTGWRVGWLVAPAAVVDTIGKIIEFNTSGANSVAQRAGLAALTQEQFVRDIRAHYAHARDMVHTRLSKLPKVRMARPQAAFYAFFQVEGMTDSVAFCKRVVREANVGLAPGRAFGPEGEGWIRLCFAISHDKLAEALDRLEPMLK
ncbi:MAG: pyridoxal phosphate-dependent aminotransferase [Rhodospirillales bacterium]